MGYQECCHVCRSENLWNTRFVALTRAAHTETDVIYHRLAGISELLPAKSTMDNLTASTMAYDLLGSTESVNKTALSEWYLNHPAVPIYIAIITPLMVFGSFGNCLVIAAVLVVKDLRTVGNIFIMNLALADLCVSSFINIFNIVGALEGEVWFLERPLLCDAVVIVCVVSCGASLLSIGLVGFNRYIHICKHELYDRLFTPLNTIVTCILVWIFCFVVLELPMLVPGGPGGHRFEWKGYYCSLDRTADYWWNVVYICVLFGTPLTLTLICYLKIFMYVDASKKRIAAMNAANDKQAAGKDTLSSQQKKDSTRLARTLFVIFIVFAVSYTPWSLIVALDRYDRVPLIVFLWSVVFAHGSSSINWLLYALTNKQFRKAYVIVLRLHKCCPTLAAKMEGTATVIASRTTESSAVDSTSAPAAGASA